MKKLNRFFSSTVFNRKTAMLPQEKQGQNAHHPESYSSQQQWQLETLEPRILLSADLAIGLNLDSHPAPILQNDSLSVLVQNIGDQKTPANININLYASLDSALGEGDLLIGSKNLKKPLLAQSELNQPISIKLPESLSPGQYHFFAVVDANQTISEANETNNSSAPGNAVDVAWKFGSVSGKKDTTVLTVTGEDGTRAKFTLTGGGEGSITQSNNQFFINLTGTTAASKLSIEHLNKGHGAMTIGAIQADAGLKSIVLKGMDFKGSMTIHGALAQLNAGNIADSQIQVLSRGNKLDIKADHIQNLNLTSATAMGQFRAIDWLDTDNVADSLTAPALKSLLLSGAMQANIHLTGEGVSGQILKSVEIKGQVSGDWLIQGQAGTLNMGSTSQDWSAAFSGTVAALKTKGDLNGFLATPALQWLKVGGNLNQTEVIVGADLGADGLVGGTDANADHYTPGVLTKLQINGDVTNSLIRVGVDPVDGQFDNGNDVLLGAAQSRIKELSVAGHLSGTTQIIAGAFPAKVRINGKRVSAASVAALSQRVIDHQAPTLTASLANDTGTSSSDGITKDPTVQGMVADALGPLKLFAALDPANAETVLTDLSGLLASNGQYQIDANQLAGLAGGALSNGQHSLRLVAEDAAGNRSAMLELAFALDSSAPAINTVGLAISSDTGTVGDGMTAAARVNITGHAEAGSTVVLGNITTLAGAGGVFQLTDVALAEGNNTLNLSITDSVGNVGQTVLNITRQGTISTDVALTWNQQALEVIREDVLDPTIATRVLALVSLAQFDTLASIEGTPAFLVHYAVESQINTNIALAKAAQTVLSELFPARRDIFDAALAQTLVDVSDGAAKSNALLLGQNIGQSVMALREHDGSDAFIDYNGSNEVGQWRAMAPMYLVAEDPQWATIDPFVLNSPDQFRPATPPALDSAAYAAAINEVQSLGNATGSSRTDDQTQQAQFWADGKGSYTPPGHWNRIAEQMAQAQANSLSANVRLFAQLNLALADSAIACWDAKYTYKLWRPIDAIQHADQDNNAATIQDTGWTPLLITPAHPEYVSGHSTFSHAAASILANSFGDNTAFSTDAYTLPGVTRSFTSFSQAAEESGRSRIYGGIHYEFSNQAGKQLGQQVAQAVLARFALTEDKQAPNTTTTNIPAVSNTNLNITGQILDNISGVTQAQYRIDSGELQSLALDAQGNFSFNTGFALDGSQDGSHSISIFAQDAAGNQSSAYSKTVILDTKAPVMTFTSLADGATLDAASRLTGSADPGSSTLTALSYSFDGGQERSLIFNKVTGAFDEPLLLGNLTVGTHTLSLSALDAAGNTAVLSRSVVLAQAPALLINSISPADAAADVGVTFRPQITFSRSVDTRTLTSDSLYLTGPDGQKLPTTIVPAADGSYVWLFPTVAMPGAAKITLTVNGSLIKALDGSVLDANADGVAGGVLNTSFTTVSTASVFGTKLIGKVVDPGADLEPMSYDDIRRGADGIIHTADDVFLNPIVHAKVYILGQEDKFVYTDANGNFELTDVPVGVVKVAVDGRTATNAPSDIFWPEMVMDVTLRPGVTNTVMGGMGTTEVQLANNDRQEIYLPRVPTSSLQTISDSAPTTVTVDASSAPDLSDAQRQALTLKVNPGSAIGADGQVLNNVQIGIATVPPELVKDMLPPGVLQHTYDITIQAPGVAAFTQPVQISFPNVFNAAPGEKLNILSFDHTTGRLVINGTATVTADGLSVVSDEGVGIRAPGWHGLANTGALGQFLVAIMDIAENPCVQFGLGAAEIVVGALTVGALAIGATTALPALAAAGVVLGAAQAIDSGVNLGHAVVEGKADKDFIVGTAEDISKGGQGILVEGEFTNRRISLMQTGAEGSASAFLAGDMSKWGKIFEGANTLLRTAAFLNLVDNLKKCSSLDVSSINSISSSLSALSNKLSSIERSIESQQISVLELYINDLKYMLEPLEDALDIMIGDGIRARLPSNLDGYLLNYTDSYNVYSINGTPYIDPSTGLQATFSVDDVLRPDIENNPEILRQIQLLAFQSEERLKGGDGARDSLYNSGADVVKALVNARSDELLTEGRPISPSGTFYVAVRSLSTGELVMQSKQSATAPIDIFLGSNQAFSIEVYNPSTNSYGLEAFVTPPSGQSFSGQYFSSNLNKIVLLRDITLDSDGDGLSNLAERVIGTKAFETDSDGDGVSDTAEVVADTNPLNGHSTVTGVVASATLKGESKAIGVDQSVTLATPIVAVATCSYGIAYIDVSQPNKPTILRETDLAGNSTDVSFDGSLGYAAVASNAGGLNLVDLNGNVRNIAINAAVAEIVDGIVYANNGGELRSYDLLTGERLQTLVLGSSAIVAMTREGQMLYTVDAAKVLRAIDLSNGVMQARGTLTLPSAAAKLFVGGGVAYIGAGNGGTGGFMTVDVGNPAALALLSGVDNNGIAGTAIAATGSGLGVAVGSSFFANGFKSLDLVDLSDPSNTAGFLTRINLPQVPNDVVIAGGLAFVADGTAGLQVVNYRAFDTLGNAPLVSAVANVSDLDPATAGIQVQEGTTIQIKPTVTDDVQVRGLELLVNGQVVKNDLSFPFDLSANLPTLAANGSDTVTLQVRATDTGGNIGLSTPIELKLVADTVAPKLISSNVSEGSTKSSSFRTVSLVFSEAMNESSLNAATVQLLGPDGQAVTPINIQFRQQGREVQFTFNPLAKLGNYQLRLDAALITDRTGNALGSAVQTTPFTVRAYSTEWIGAAGGFWDVASNWSNGLVPTETDDVYIGQAGSTITIRSGVVKLASLVSDANISLTGGTLELLGESRINGQFNQSGGTLTGVGALTLAGTGSQWTGGLMTGGGITKIAAGADFTVSGGGRKYLGNRTINNEGTLIEASTSNLVDFDGTAILNNSGVFDIRSDTVWQDYAGSAGSLTLNNSGTLKKTVGTGDFFFLDTALNNTGTVDAQTGQLKFGGSGGVSSGQFVTSLGASIQFVAGTQTWQTGAKATGSGAIVLTFLNGATGGTLLVNNDVEINRLDIQDLGVLSGTGTVNVTGTGSQWTGGLMTGGGVTKIAVGADFTLSGGGRKYLGNRTINNEGTLIEASTSNLVDFDGTAILNNSGVFDIRSDTVWQDYAGAAGALTLNNSGILKKSSGSGDFVFRDLTLNNFSKIDVSAGTIVLASGQANLGNSSHINGPNPFTLNGGTLSVAAGEEAFAEKLSVVSGSITGAGTLTINGIGSLWTGGLMTGGGITKIAAGADFTVSGGGRKYLGNRTINNEGTLIEASTSNLVDFDGTAILNNSGVFDIRSDTVWQDYAGSAGTLTLNNSGTLKKTVGTGDFFFLDTALNNTGTVDAQTGQLKFGGSGGVSRGQFVTSLGASIQFVAGTQTWQTGAKATGSGAIVLTFLNGATGGTLLVNNDVEVNRLDIQELGVLSGTGTVNITGTGSLWTGGLMTGGGVTKIAVGADFTLSGGGRKYLGNRTINNEGTLIEASSADRVELDGTAVLNNSGVLDIRSNTVWRHSTGAAGSLILDNTGSINKTAGAGVFNFYNTTFNNAGTVSKLVGSIQVNNVVIV